MTFSCMSVESQTFNKIFENIARRKFFTDILFHSKTNYPRLLSLEETR